MKTLTLGAQRRPPFICEEEQPQEDSRLDPGMSGFRRDEDHLPQETTALGRSEPRRRDEN